MKHAIITRLKYKTLNDTIIHAKIMSNTLLPAIKNQSNKNFTWIIIMDPDHQKQILKIIDHPFLQANSIEQSFDIIKKSNIQIQSSIDADDIVSTRYVDLVQTQANQNRECKSLVIHFQVFRWYSEKNILEYRSKQYGQNLTSMFYSIYQPIPVIPWYIDDHHCICKYVDKVITMPPGDVLWNHHSCNYHKQCSKDTYGALDI